MGSSVGWEGYYASGVLLLTLGALIRNVAAPETLFLGALGLVLVARVIPVQDGLKGFSNEGLLSVVMLFTVAAGVSETGALDYYMGRLLGRPQTVWQAQARLMLPIAIASAFINNTPVVSIMIPIVQTWARKSGLDARQLLIPLSYSAIVGGTTTLIGTSTNLVVRGLFEERYDNRSIGIFDLGRFGVPAGLSCMMFILLASPFLLTGGHRRRNSSSATSADHTQEEENDGAPLAMGAIIPSGSPLAGKTIHGAGLRGLDGLYVFSVQRGNMVVSRVGPEFVLNEGDLLHFTGEADRLNEVCSEKGLVPLSNELEEMLEMCNQEEGRMGKAELDHHVASPSLEEKHDEAVQDGQDGNAVDKLHLPPQRLESLTPVERTNGEMSHSQPVSSGTAASLRKIKSVTELIQDRCTPDGVREALTNGTTLVRAKIKPGSRLIGMNAKTFGFRAKYKAAIIAVHRQGRSVSGKIGEVVLQEGDVLLLQAGKDSPLISSRHRPPPLAESAGASDDLDEAEGGTEFPQVNQDLQILPTDRRTRQEGKQFMIHMRLQHDSPISGKTVEGAGLRGLPGLFLASIQRQDGETLPAVSPDERIEGGDVLSFVGELHSVASLRRIPGLVPHTNQVDKLQEKSLNRRLVQVVVANHGPLVGRTVRELGFRTKYDAVIIAVKRAGGRINKRIGDIELTPGDVLLLDTGKSFVENYRNDSAFALVSELENSTPPRFHKLIPALFFLAAMVALSVSGVVPLLVGAILASGGMLITGCATQDQLRRAIRWDVYLTIAAAFGMSEALKQTGVAGAVASGLVTASQKANTGTVGLLFAVYLATALLSNVVTNNAAAAIMFPISASAAESEGTSPERLSFLLMLAASAAFMTPFGYQTNLMVFGAGGYKFKHFLEFGAPMQAVHLVTSVVAVSLDKWWWLLWIVTWSLFFLFLVNGYVLDFLAGGRRRVAGWLTCFKRDDDRKGGESDLE